MDYLRRIFDKMVVSLQPNSSDGQPLTVEVIEGSAKIVSEKDVFYNPVQQFNRDLSISVLRAFWQLCQSESEQRKSGATKILGNNFTVS